VFTLSGTALNIISKGLDKSLLTTKQNLFLVILWIFVVVSYFWGSDASISNDFGLSAERLLSLTNNMFIFYFCGCLVIKNIKQIRYLAGVFVISTIYLIYWGNFQYFTGNWSSFNWGRLFGPVSITGGSIYGDENAFAMLFVTGLPFIYYLGFELKRNWLRYLLWAFIPFGFHAIFLTGSRGGLLGLCTVILLVFLKSNRKLLALPAVLLCLFFYQWQAGATMKERGATISDTEESSVNARLTAWKGGGRMIESHPLTGVGLGSFATVLPRFIESKPRVAHNTLIQFAAESGIGAGIAYLLAVVWFFVCSQRISRRCHAIEDNDTRNILKVINDASCVSFTGLTVCSLFLSLNVYEVFLYLILINNSLYVYSYRDTKLTERPFGKEDFPCRKPTVDGG
jgi:O-antigen ligase